MNKQTLALLGLVFALMLSSVACMPYQRTQRTTYYETTPVVQQRTVRHTTVHRHRPLPARRVAPRTTVYHHHTAAPPSRGHHSAQRYTPTTGRTVTTTRGRTNAKKTTTRGRTTTTKKSNARVISRTVTPVRR